MIDPAIISARDFRVLLDALARPGKAVPFTAVRTAPKGLLPGTAALMTCLCDFQTPVWLSPSLGTAGVREWLRFQTGAPLTGEPRIAQFVFARAGDYPPLSSLSIGTPEYPDRSATVVIEVESFSGAFDVVLEGPGIETSESLAVSPLDTAFFTELSMVNAGFPLGIDVILVAPRAIAGVPRSVRFREAA